MIGIAHLAEIPMVMTNSDKFGRQIWPRTRVPNGPMPLGRKKTSQRSRPNFLGGRRLQYKGCEGSCKAV